MYAPRRARSSSSACACRIALHEIGHLVPAKRFGVRVTQYMVGFGPTIWSRRRGETEYGVKAIPLGGYIRMIGMFPPGPATSPAQLRASSTGRFSQLDRRGPPGLAWRRSGPATRTASSTSCRCRKKVVVMLGGPTMNLLIAVVLLTGVTHAVRRRDELRPRGSSSVSQCVRADRRRRPRRRPAAPSDPKTPANTAGLQPGDRIVSIGGQPVSALGPGRPAHPAQRRQPLAVVVERDGTRRR